MDFDRLARKHRDAVYRQMVRVCGNHDDAEDALIEALLAGFKASDAIRDDGNFRAWLGSVAKRACYRLKRRQDLTPLLDHLAEAVPDTRPAPDARMEAEEVKQCVQKAIAGLPPSLLDVYTMREIEGRSAEETAANLKLTVAAVKSRLHRARTIVRENLDQSICGPL